MKIATQRLLRHISKPSQNATILHSTTKTSLSLKPSFNHFCVVSLRSNRMYFSTGKDVAVEESNTSFDGEDSNLSNYIKNPKTIEILQKKGIKSLFPIQIETFEAVYSSRDLLASDRTGSGKTIAYSLPILQKLRDNGIFKSGKKQVKFLVMCPTRELTLQVFKEISSLKHSSNDFNVVAVYGGASIDDQVRQLRNGVDVIVATPGRLMDLVERRTINFSELEATCIDEADQMLEKGFKLDIEEIFSLIQKQRQAKTQNLMFSATIPDWVDKISSQYMENKKRINLISKSQTQTSTTVQHLAVECSNKERVKCIQALIKTYNPSEDLSTIIFAQTKLEVTDIALEFGKEAAFLQGDMEQKERQFNLNAFRNGTRRVLVATDVASRGLDIDNVGLVIQLEPPRNTEPFIHRAGRTGRAGRKGICITLFDRKRHLQSMVRIEQEAKITFKHIPRPQMSESQSQWQDKLNEVPSTLKSITNSTLAHEKLNKMADLLISSHSDVRELVKRQLAAIAGEPPAHVSLTSQEAGYKTHIIHMKDGQEGSVNTMELLNFIKSNFATLKVTNVHVQSQSVIFDVPEDSLADFSKLLNRKTIKQNIYEIREASGKDRQMTSLREMARGSRSRAFEDRGNSRVFEERDNHRRSFRTDRKMEFKAEKTTGTVFIPRLPYELQQKHFISLLDQMNITYDSVRLKKKGEDYSFAFVQISDEQSFKQLTQNGLILNGQKYRGFISQPPKDSSQSFGGRDGNRGQGKSYVRSSGFERKDNYEKRRDNQSGRSRRDEDDY